MSEILMTYLLTLICSVNFDIDECNIQWPSSLKCWDSLIFRTLACCNHFPINAVFKELFNVMVDYSVTLFRIWLYIYITLYMIGGYKDQVLCQFCPDAWCLNVVMKQVESTLSITPWWTKKELQFASDDFGITYYHAQHVA